ncbi:predicted protein [Chaetoceros tenuissimus]|uniref:Uncharacterized protein n=1 Tax=Chaetoceros tenuissimus TaxID=426638 RepID=A0AAD3H9I5_9STRA|nr:predicted protein [Chaetoceros tenuissimus]
MNLRDVESLERRGFTSETERGTTYKEANRGTSNDIQLDSVAWNLLNQGSKNQSINRNKDTLRGNGDARRRGSSTSIPYYSSNSGMYHALDYRNIGIRLEKDAHPRDRNTTRETSIGDESSSIQSSTPRRSQPILIPRKVEEEEEQEMMSRNSSKELERYFESKTDRMNERRRRSFSHQRNASWDPINAQQSGSLNSTTSFNTFFLDHGVLTLEEDYE